LSLNNGQRCDVLAYDLALLRLLVTENFLALGLVVSQLISAPGSEVRKQYVSNRVVLDRAFSADGSGAHPEGLVSVDHIDAAGVRDLSVLARACLFLWLLHELAERK